MPRRRRGPKPAAVRVPLVSARLVVLASGSGTLLQALLDAGRDRSGQDRAGTARREGPEPRYPAEVVAVVTDRPGVEALERARRAGVAADPVSPTDFADRKAWDQALADRVAAHKPDLVVLAGFMKILGPHFLGRFPGRVINTHPSLLPAFPGAHAVRDALVSGATVTGASVIWVDEGIDTGQVIAQAEVPVRSGDDEARLHERIKVVERQMLVRVVAELVTAFESVAPGGRG